ncbi:hypothetical protein [Fodinibius sp. Rm-B-1B1-1]|uniref:hypothetical protein n=1 Tax=Fodinibius alkaliphilus TaxID=3140241 RepID=UPI00315AAF53
MKKQLPIFAVFLLGISIWSCERPKSPDFQVNQQFEIPLTVDKTYQFLGADDALLDTTSEDFENLFETSEEGLVSVVKEQKFNFGDLNSAIPEVYVPSIEIVDLTVPPTNGAYTVTANGSSSIDNSTFEFQDSDHFVGMDAGVLTLAITNGTDVSIDLEIAFPEVQTPNQSSLVITIDDVSPNENISNSFSLADHRIYAGEDNEIDFEITVSTSSSSVLGGDITTEVGFENLGISRAEGYILPKNVLLNGDATSDGELDIFNDNEAEITNIDGISDISEHISDITFSNPILGTLYNSNLGVNTTIYAVIAGTKSNDAPVYLTGDEGSVNHVTASEIPDALTVNGEQATEEEVIKFSLDAVDNPSPNQGEEGSNEFNADNANTPTFFSNLPTSIRFIGVARINADEDPDKTHKIVNPVIFDPSLGVEIPFSLSADNASYKDTVDADLGDLPGKDDDSRISEASVKVNYTNGLPLVLGLDLIMLDAKGNEVLRKSDIAINAATIDENGFASAGAESDHQISFTKDELNILNETRSMVLDVRLSTPEQQSVSVKESDAVTFRVQVKAGITSTVN